MFFFIFEAFKIVKNNLKLFIGINLIRDTSQCFTDRSTDQCLNLFVILPDRRNRGGLQGAEKAAGAGEQLPLCVGRVSGGVQVVQQLWLRRCGHLNFCSVTSVNLWWRLAPVETGGEETEVRKHIKKKNSKRSRRLCNCLKIRHIINSPVCTYIKNGTVLFDLAVCVCVCILTRHRLWHTKLQRGSSYVFSLFVGIQFWEKNPVTVPVHFPLSFNVVL